jgi:hypothetical protein
MGRAISGILNYPTPASPQVLDSFAQGEDVSITFALTSTALPSTWVNVEFTLIPEGKGQSGRFTTSITAGGILITGVSTTSPYTATVTVTLSHATTVQFGAGSASWQCEWVDSGNVSVLGAGEIGVTIPLVPIP